MFFMELEVFDLKYFAENSFYIINGKRTEWGPIRSVINHTSDYQNRTTTKRESDLLIRDMVTDIIIYIQKLLDSDWLKTSAFFV